MQNPAGITMDLERGRAQMNDIWAVLSQPLQVRAYSHVAAAAVLSAVMFARTASWFLMKQRDVEVFRPSKRIGLVGMLIGSSAVLVTGDLLAKAMAEVQPMKMAAAEALYETTNSSFSLITIGNLDGSKEIWSIRVPNVLSCMATGSPSGTVEGIDDVQQRFAQQYRPGDYRPKYSERSSTCSTLSRWRWGCAR